MRGLIGLLAVTAFAMLWGVGGVPIAQVFSHEAGHAITAALPETSPGLSAAYDRADSTVGAVVLQARADFFCEQQSGVLPSADDLAARGSVRLMSLDPAIVATPILAALEVPPMACGPAG